MRVCGEAIETTCSLLKVVCVHGVYRSDASALIVAVFAQVRGCAEFFFGEKIFTGFALERPAPRA